MNSTPKSPAPIWACWLLHLYTAVGAFIGLQAVFAADRGDGYLAFQLMFLTIFIDATDGTIARRMRVHERIPRIDGRRLDDIVDFFTYVLVPMYALVKLGLIATSGWIWAIPILTSALGFANVEAKTDDDYFLGFPSYWNLVALYLFCLGFPVWLNTLIILVLAVLVLAPVKFIYPSKTKPYQLPTMVLGTIWAMQTFCLVAIPDRLPEWWLPAAMFYPIYYVSLSAHLHRTTSRV